MLAGQQFRCLEWDYWCGNSLGQWRKQAKTTEKHINFRPQPPHALATWAANSPAHLNNARVHHNLHSLPTFHSSTEGEPTSPSTNSAKCGLRWVSTSRPVQLTFAYTVHLLFRSFQMCRARPEIEISQEWEIFHSSLVASRSQKYSSTALHSILRIFPFLLLLILAQLIVCGTTPTVEFVCLDTAYIEEGCSSTADAPQ